MPNVFRDKPDNSENSLNQIQKAAGLNKMESEVHMILQFLNELQVRKKYVAGRCRGKYLQ